MHKIFVGLLYVLHVKNLIQSRLPSSLLMTSEEKSFVNCIFLLLINSKHNIKQKIFEF